MYPCEKCGLPRDGKNQFNNSGLQHNCIAALKAEIDRLQAFIATMPGGPGQYADWKSKQVAAAKAEGGE